MPPKAQNGGYRVAPRKIIENQSKILKTLFVIGIAFDYIAFDYMESFDSFYLD